MTYLAFPLHVAPSGLEATADYAAHVEQMVEEVLFTSPGERVNRPEFGVGVMALVFGPETPELQTATQFLIQSNLQRFLGQYVRVQDVSATARESTFSIVVEYTLLATGETRTSTFSGRRS